MVYVSIFARADSDGTAQLGESTVLNSQATGWIAKTLSAKKNFINAKHCHFPPLDELFWHELLVLCCVDTMEVQHEDKPYTVFEYGIQHGGLMLATMRTGGTYLSYETNAQIRKQIDLRIAARMKGT